VAALYVVRLAAHSHEKLSQLAKSYIRVGWLTKQGIFCHELAGKATDRVLFTVTIETQCDFRLRPLRLTKYIKRVNGTGTSPQIPEEIFGEKDVLLSGRSILFSNSNGEVRLKTAIFLPSKLFCKQLT
jgi:hypothetical protein